MSHWHWLALAGALAIAEALVPGCMLLGLGAAAALLGLALLVGPPLDLPVQLALFAGLALICLYGWRRWRRAFPAGGAAPTLNRRAAQYVGRHVSLIAPMVNGRGRVRLGDSVWTVSGADDLPAGRTVEVTGVDGTVLQVRALAPGETEPLERAG